MHREEVGSKTVIRRGTHPWPAVVALALGMVLPANVQLFVVGNGAACMVGGVPARGLLQAGHGCEPAA